jgi:hypothetical protein
MNVEAQQVGLLPQPPTKETSLKTPLPAVERPEAKPPTIQLATTQLAMAATQAQMVATQAPLAG